jgi:hypothetical protein
MQMSGGYKMHARGRIFREFCAGETVGWKS